VTQIDTDAGASLFDVVLYVPPRSAQVRYNVSYAAACIANLFARGGVAGGGGGRGWAAMARFLAEHGRAREDR
jgi:hypothetical protein